MLLFTALLLFTGSLLVVLTNKKNPGK
jgi:hypothetical protein